MKRFLVLLLIFLLFPCISRGSDVVKTIDIQYPVVERIRGHEGYGVYAISIANKRVIDIAVKTSTGYQRLDKAVLEAVKHWRFMGFHANTVFLPVVFTLE